MSPVIEGAGVLVLVAVRAAKDVPAPALEAGEADLLLARKATASVHTFLLLLAAIAPFTARPR